MREPGNRLLATTGLDLDLLGQAAYESYWFDVRGGPPEPGYADLPQTLQHAWRLVAATVATDTLLQQSSVLRERFLETWTGPATTPELTWVAAPLNRWQRFVRRFRRQG